MQTHTHHGRDYEVLASFTGVDRAQQAADYIRTHLHVKVLCDAAGETLIVSDRDMGKPAEAQHSDFGVLGWTSLYVTADCGTPAVRKASERGLDDEAH